MITILTIPYLLMVPFKIFRRTQIATLTLQKERKWKKYKKKANLNKTTLQNSQMIKIMTEV